MKAYQHLSGDEAVCRQLVFIKWLLAVVVGLLAGTILSIFVAAMVFRTQVTELSPAETNQFLSDVFTMAANGRAASEDVPPLVSSMSAMARMAQTSMSQSNSTAPADILDTIAAVLDKDNLQSMAAAVAAMPWEEQILPLASQLLRNTENLEKVMLLIISALQQEAHPSYIIAEVKE